ncbi:MAG: stage IV sporulation protein A [Candidatus Paraimprobicoccus trichonymphae]|uniref:Stage IV sporulation protein A n=1 Tax=Candidatus Paraimprobicoccus trichonymphae TaxID=3033793 RepID=A0AA48KZZ9_9FIRM|nr:MAG: stage IV sporulation protein A [Candidatus Paraimprobicoccus trichonymphae]
MEERNIYRDIAQRTNGDIYIGVVGPVRSGKSTFIKKFMDTLVIPNISNLSQKERAIDELPQSAAGRTIMTTEPKFIPEDAVEVNIGEKAKFKTRMIDCVGYIVPSALGYVENETPRMVQTPWFKDEIPFNMAAEIGTKKVITDHSTVGLVITTDGSISDIERSEYQDAEERVIAELKEIDKPFIVLLNSTEPYSESNKALAEELSKKYDTPVIPINCLELGEEEIKRILAQILFEFPVKEVKINIPRWLSNLEKDHWLRSDIYSSVQKSAQTLNKIREIQNITKNLSESNYVKNSEIDSVDLGTGQSKVSLVLDPSLFYKILSEKTNLEISDECALMDCILDFSKIKAKYDKISAAYDEVNESGYGIVIPTIDELSLDEPEIIKQGSKYGIKLRASAPSVHMLKTKIFTEITPIVGTEQQSEDLIMYLLQEFEENPAKIWESNIFGKSLHELVNEGLQNKLYRMPSDARNKIKETIEKIINDGCNGLICIII